MAAMFKDKLLTARNSLKLLQKEIADKLGVSVETYRSWEKGRRTPSNLAIPEIEKRLSAILPAHR